MAPAVPATPLSPLAPAVAIAPPPDSSASLAPLGAFSPPAVQALLAPVGTFHPLALADAIAPAAVGTAPPAPECTARFLSHSDVQMTAAALVKARISCGAPQGAHNIEAPYHSAAVASEALFSSAAVASEAPFQSAAVASEAPFQSAAVALSNCFIRCDRRK